MPKQPEPCLENLLETGQAMRVACNVCDKVRYWRAQDVVNAYGRKLRFSEIRTLIRNRCRGAECAAQIGPSIKAMDEIPKFDEPL